MMSDEDPLLISQSLTYVTDDGSVLHSFKASPLSSSFKAQMLVLEVSLVATMVLAVPTGAHGTVVGVCLANLIILAWFWYNLVRSVDITSEGALRLWIGNIEVDVPFDRILSIRRVATSMPCSVCVTSHPYRGFLATPTDGVAIVTSLPSSPFWLWPRSSGKPDRKILCFSCPKLTVVFSPAGGGLAFCRQVENEMHNLSSNRMQEPNTSYPDYLDV